MLSAKRTSDGEAVLAYFERSSNGPFACLECGDEVRLRTGKRRVSHFFHAYPRLCQNGVNESETHRTCKREIFEALQSHPDVSQVSMERAFEGFRADIYAVIRGTPVAIEVQISTLSPETILRRTIQYCRKGIAVLWLLPWSAKLDAERYTPRLWEKWLHAAYFGRVYYHLRDLSIASYRFDPILTPVPATTWRSPLGRLKRAGGYSRKSKRFRKAVRSGRFHLIEDFFPKMRTWWEGGEVKVPDALLWMERFEL